MKTIFTSIRMLIVTTLLLGGVYPLAIWAVGRVFFHAQAEGSQVSYRGVVVGSALLSQKTESPRYFWPRPSAADYATVASGASNQPWSSKALQARIAASPYADERATQSGSGLDPHLTPGAVLAQMDRVAAARGWNTVQCNRVAAWIAVHTEGGIIGPRYVNVLLLNLALENLENAR
jgi:potassium-transporting ATPase KdpC subunit